MLSRQEPTQVFRVCVCVSPLPVRGEKCRQKIVSLIATSNWIHFPQSKGSFEHVYHRLFRPSLIEVLNFYTPVNRTGMLPGPTEFFATLT